MKIELAYPHEKVNTAIIDTAKIVNQYRLDRKQYNGYNRLWDNLTHYDFSVLRKDDSVTVLDIIPFSKGKELEGVAGQEVVNIFMSNLNRVLKGEVVITAEILNKDPYKDPNQLNLVTSLLVLIASLAAIYYGLQAFFM